MDNRELSDALDARKPRSAFARLEALPVRVARKWVLGALAVFVFAAALQQLFIYLFALALSVTDQSAAASKSGVGAWWATVGGSVGLWLGFAVGTAVVVKLTTSASVRQGLGLSFNARDLWGIPVGIVAQFALSGLTSLLFDNNGSGATERWLKHLHGGSLVFITIGLCIIVPLVEESLFRGLLGRGLFSLVHRDALPHRVLVGMVIVADGAIFSAAHGEPSAFVALALFGALLQTFQLRTGRLGLSIATHSAFNAAAVLPFVLRGHL